MIKWSAACVMVTMGVSWGVGPVVAQRPASTGSARIAPRIRRNPGRPGTRKASPSPSQSLLQELLSLRTLAAMKLTAQQMKPAAMWIDRGDHPGMEAGDALTGPRRLSALLQKERDVLAARQPLSETLFADLTAEQAAQAAWIARRDRYVQNAAQSILSSLTPEQKNVLLNAPPTPYQVDAARAMVQEAVQATPDAYADLKAALLQKNPDGGARIAGVLETARTLKPLDISRQLNILAGRIAEITAYTAPVPPASQTEPALATALSTLLQSPSVQRTLLKVGMPAPPKTGDGGASLSPALVAFDALAALQGQQNQLQQQVQALAMFSALGFTPTQIGAALPWFHKAEGLRQQSEDQNHDIQAALMAAIEKVSDAIAHGQDPPPDANANSPELVTAVQFEQRNIHTELQSAALALLKSMPAASVAQFAATEAPPDRLGRVMNVLNTIRSYTLAQYLANEPGTIRQLLPAAGSEANDTKIKGLLRQARLMTDGQFQTDGAQVLRSLAVIIQPPLPPAPAPAVGKVANPKAEELDLHNRASQRLAASLDVPGLSEALSVGVGTG